MLSTQAGQFSSEMIPTIGFNMRKVTKGGVTIKLWVRWTVPVVHLTRCRACTGSGRVRLPSLPSHALRSDVHVQPAEVPLDVGEVRAGSASLGRPS